MQSLVSENGEQHATSNNSITCSMDPIMGS